MSEEDVLKSGHEPTRRAQLGLGLGLLLLAILYFLRLGRPTLNPAFGDDNAIYLVSAISIAQGSGYRLINFPTDPPASFYPVGYPLILSLVLNIFKFTPLSLRIALVFNILFYIYQNYKKN